MQTISTEYGVLVPQYEDSTVRKKYISINQVPALFCSTCSDCSACNT